MSLVKLKEKGQLTIPASIRQKIAAHKGDLFEVTLSGGNILLTPQGLAPRASKATQGPDIAKYIGVAKGVFGSKAAIDDYVAGERSSWE